MQSLKTLATLRSWAGQFESYLAANPHDVAHTPVTYRSIQYAVSVNDLFVNHVSILYRQKFVL